MGQPDPRSQLIKAMNGGMMCLEQVCKLASAHPELYDAKSDDSWTPLHFATDLDLAKRLLAKGADVNTRTNDGLTPLHLAANDGSADLAELLLANTAKVDAKDNWNSTDVVALLRAHGAKE